MMKVDSSHNCFRYNWARAKTNFQWEYLLMFNLSKWWLCFGHALATQLVLSKSASDEMFSEISEAKMNRELKLLYSNWESSTNPHKPFSYTKGVTMHGFRAFGNKTLQKYDIEKNDRKYRGGWVVDRVQIKRHRSEPMSRYEDYDDRRDARCAKILSFSSTEESASCPSLSLLPDAEVEPFKIFAVKLIGTIGDSAAATFICATLLVHAFPDSYAKYPKHPLHDMMLIFATVENILLWAAHFQVKVTSNASTSAASIETNEHLNTPRS